MSHLDITTPEQLPEGATRVGPLVAWGHMPGSDRIWVWHWCDHHLWAGRQDYDAHPDRYVFWVPSGIAAHTLVSADPLHVEPSVYWPDCCGLHGFIRDGKWVDA